MSGGRGRSQLLLERASFARAGCPAEAREAPGARSPWRARAGASVSADPGRLGGPGSGERAVGPGGL